MARPREQGSAPPAASPSPGLLGHTNDEAGYTLDYPASWELAEEVTTSRVASPDGTAIVSFGLGANGSLDDASDRFRASLEDIYEDLEITSTETVQLGGLPGRSIAAEATNEDGVRIHIQAVTVAASDRNYAISAFTAEDADPDVLGLVQQIVESFRAPG